MNIIFLMLFGLYVSPLRATIDDWESYGTILSQKDLHFDEGVLWGASNGGLVSWDGDNFDVFTNIDFLEHIRISTFHIDSYGNKWFGYDAKKAEISWYSKEGSSKHFDLGLSAVYDICSDSENVFVAYQSGMQTGIAHFVLNNGEFVFKDFYDQFPLELGLINAIEIFQDKIYLGTDSGILFGNVSNPNLKPPDAWSVLLNSGLVKYLDSTGDLLYYSFMESNDDVSMKLITYDGTYIDTLMNISKYNPVIIFEYSNIDYIVSTDRVWRNMPGGLDYIIDNGKRITGACADDGFIYLSILNGGIMVYDTVGTYIRELVPNSPFADKYQVIDLDNQGHPVLGYPQGLSILYEEGWHNIIRSDTIISINENIDFNEFSSDTIAYTLYGSPALWDLHITQTNTLYMSYNGVNVSSSLYDYIPVQNPGPVLQVDLNNIQDYEVIDTTDDVFHGSEASTAGSSIYVVTRGITESPDGSVWIINAHASNNEPLIRIKSNGIIEKYSIEESGNTLQVLGNEMAVDNFNRLWIANQSHPENAPITVGGITIFDTFRDEWYLITTAQGLVNNDILSINKDIDGSMWVVTGGGVQNITVPALMTQASFTTDFRNYIRAPLEGISNVNVTKVRIDVRGNKWFMTTVGGVKILLRNATWFNDGYGYTIDNSPLLSNFIMDLSFDDNRGYAYILTEAGLNRVETAWASEITTVENIEIYPQPYKPGSHPYLVINNVPDQSDVVISTLNGRVLKTIKSDSPGNYGRQILWDGLLANGSPISRGVYYIFIYNIDGMKRTLKLAVQ